MTLTFLLSLLLAAAPQCAAVPPLELPAAQEMLEARRKALTQRLNREAEPACRQALGAALGETSPQIKARAPQRRLASLPVRGTEDGAGERRQREQR